MNILTQWLRSYLPELSVTDAQLAEDLTLRGIAVEGIFPAPGGSRFEMDITTNRVDAMNHYGIAREAAAIYNVALAPLDTGVAHSSAASSPMSGVAVFPVRIEARELCGRFTARIIRGVTVKQSTGILADSFAALGQKPISAPVDATNFSWLAMGQPTHVFDLDKLSGGIVVRLARAGEKLHLLDGTERTLTADDLVVADEKQVQGLAGVMGGWDSRVTEATKNILVEAAWFDPAAVRASSRRHGLHTDASHRYERGADFNAAPLGNHLVTRLVVEQSGGEVAGPLTDVIIPELAARTANRPAITLRISEIKRHLGATLDGKEIGEKLVAQYLSALGCTLTESGTGLYKVQLPSWRLDLEREIDLIEEVARVYGYNKFADTLPSFAGSVVELPHAAQERALRETLLALGYSEAVSSTFVSAEEAATFSAASAVAMGNPLSAEAGMLRPALTPGMATMLAENLHRDVNAVRLFELGTVFTGSAAEVHEETGLALGATGAAAATPLHAEKDALFYQVKGALATLLAKFEGAVTFDAQPLPAWIEPGRGARALLAGEAIAVFGELSAAESQRRKLRQTAVLAELRAQALLTRPLRQPLARELSRFQAVERDFSFVFSDSIQWQAISTALTRLGIAELQSVTPVEIFRDAKGKAIPAGSHSLLVRVVFQSLERTLTEDELTGWSHQIIAALTSLGGAQRA
jgi:phenylalanyl-tRNA synthetase beta chain